MSPRPALYLQTREYASLFIPFTFFIYFWTSDQEQLCSEIQMHDVQVEKDCPRNYFNVVLQKGSYLGVFPEYQDGQDSDM